MLLMSISVKEGVMMLVTLVALVGIVSLGGIVIHALLRH